jgi:hypothetical protein
VGKVIIAADLGHFRAYRVVRNPMESPRVELIESYDSIEAHGKLSEKVTDQAGRFSRKSGSQKAKGSPEPHNLELELQRKMIRSIAEGIGAVLQREGNPNWYLAAEKQITNQLIESLDSVPKAKLTKSLTVNLTKVKAPEILSRFE